MNPEHPAEELEALEAERHQLDRIRKDSNNPSTNEGTK